MITYYYDELNQLTREDNEILNKTITYSYDAGGNILNKTEYLYTTGALGTPTSTISYGYGDSNWKDKLTSFNGKEITYDTIGNPLTYDGYIFTWQQGRQLAGINGNGKDVSFKYNVDGIRTEKTVNGVTTKYHLVGDRVTFEDNGTDKIYYTYDDDSNILSMNLNGTEYYYIRNAQGDINGLYDKTGAQVVSYTYDSWGKLISIDGSLKDSAGVKNPYRYRGYRYDSETGLYYLQSRYYSPEWGRFINIDSYIGTLGELLSHNMFGYCNNNFVNLLDSNGENGISAFISLVGTMVSTAVEVVAVATPVVVVGAAVLCTSILVYEGIQLYKMTSNSYHPASSDTKKKSVSQNPGPYSHLKDSSNVGSGKNFTPSQKRKIIEENKKKNKGKVKSDDPLDPHQDLVKPKKSQRGITPQQNEWQIDHIVPRSKGGTNSYGNSRVISRELNRLKWDK
ncbi:MAG: RHS repeat-associated core domain-containing protein [Clostridium sp.]|nr:RHS repeat-associated core domain-containing protein [Clostridium sp.]